MGRNLKFYNFIMRCRSSKSNREMVKSNKLSTFTKPAPPQWSWIRFNLVPPQANDVKEHFLSSSFVIIRVPTIRNTYHDVMIEYDYWSLPSVSITVNIQVVQSAHKTLNHQLLLIIVDSIPLVYFRCCLVFSTYFYAWLLAMNHYYCWGIRGSQALWEMKALPWFTRWRLNGT